MALVTLGDLVTKVRVYANQETSSFKTNDQIKKLLNAELKDLRKLLHRGGQEFQRATKEMTTIPGQAIYALPLDFNRLMTLMANRSPVQTGIVIAGMWSDPSSDSDGWLPLHPFELAEMAYLLNCRTGSADNARYRLRGEFSGSTEVQPSRQIEIRPTPRLEFTLRLEYLPTTADLTDDVAVIHGVDGYEEIPALKAAITLLALEESDTRQLQGILDGKMALLLDEVQAQDMGRPERVLDVYAQQHTALGEDDLYLPRGWLR